ncbi:hypothetical protein [Streptomyces eurocidicus]|uniref:Secreted protein n=1 Tax=Streptomyces eurocidicus TaxID=66423 RepID=A0A7W8BH39_STREU|nr:hypothetical protein [Streptomyces eurocidicus]MBB5121828.1 hypothetical protein [Streptomyces eurocidicus]MBF6055094.1 hypothetical protein [Streptomyces eurocidicus]
MLKNSRIFSAVSGLVLVVGSLVGSASVAGAVGASPQGSEQIKSCFDHFHTYYKESGAYFTGLGTTTSNCANINIWPKTTRDVRVCFYPKSGSNFCQDQYTTARANEWTSIAFDVLDGSDFSFQFRSAAQSDGWWAA